RAFGMENALSGLMSHPPRGSTIAFVVAAAALSANASAQEPTRIPALIEQQHGQIDKASRLAGAKWLSEKGRNEIRQLLGQSTHLMSQPVELTATYDSSIDTFWKLSRLPGDLIVFGNPRHFETTSDPVSRTGRVITSSRPREDHFESVIGAQSKDLNAKVT